MTQSEYDKAYIKLCEKLKSLQSESSLDLEAWFERQIDKLDKEFMT
jgi:hypothetical protein